METLHHYLTIALDFMRGGFNHVNALQGLLIALAATVFMQTWRQWFAIALLAVVIDLGFNAVAPVLSSHATFHLPALLGTPFWKATGALYAGYLLIVGVFFTLKRLLLQSHTRGSSHQRRAA